MALSLVGRLGRSSILAVGFLALVTIPATLNAQDVIDRKSAAEIRTRFLNDLDSVHVKIIALAEAIPEGRYTWSPTPETRTIANALMHVATEWYVYVPMAVAGKPPADFGSPREAVPRLEKLTAKAEVLDHLRRSWAHAKQSVETADLTALLGARKLGPNAITFAEFAFGMTGDLHEHLGQLVTYTRSIGEVPPWSRKP